MAKQSSYEGVVAASMPPKMPQNPLEARETHRRSRHSESLSTPFVSRVAHDARAQPPLDGKPIIAKVWRSLVSLLPCRPTGKKEAVAGGAGCTRGVLDSAKDNGFTYPRA